MLTTTKITSERTRVEGFTKEGGIKCSIYPTLASKECFCLKPNVDSGDLDVSQMKVGMPFDLLLIGKEVIGIESPAIHPFVIKNLYPEGLDCVTASVENQAEGIYGAVIATTRVNGLEKHFRISSQTLMFQAQQDEGLAHKIFRGLKQGDSVNLWVKKDAPVRTTGSVSAQKVQDVEYMSKNFR